MGGIYIPGMEMPTDCIFCPLFHGEWQMCSLTERGTQLIGRAKDCPLIAVPDHGRLIDADALLAVFEKDISEQDKHMELLKLAGNMRSYFYISKVQIGMVSCRRALDNAPTIISADKEGANGN